MKKLRSKGQAEAANLKLLASLRMVFVANNILRGQPIDFCATAQLALRCFSCHGQPTQAPVQSSSASETAAALTCPQPSTALTYPQPSATKDIVILAVAVLLAMIHDI